MNLAEIGVGEGNKLERMRIHEAGVIQIVGGGIVEETDGLYEITIDDHVEDVGSWGGVVPVHRKGVGRNVRNG